VRYSVVGVDGEVREIESPAQLPDPTLVDRIEEPYILATVHVPQEYVGAVLPALPGPARGAAGHGGAREASAGALRAAPRRGRHRLPRPGEERDPGYGSYDYDLIGYRPGDLVKLDMLVNGDPVDALSLIVHRDKAQLRGAELARKLKEYIPRQMYEVAIQAAIGSRVIARTTVKALRKNVTAKCYGGDITRKRKLLERQKEGRSA